MCFPAKRGLDGNEERAPETTEESEDRPQRPAEEKSSTIPEQTTIAKPNLDTTADPQASGSRKTHNTEKKQENKDPVSRNSRKFRKGHAKEQQVPTPSKEEVAPDTDVAYNQDQKNSQEVAQKTAHHEHDGRPSTDNERGQKNAEELKPKITDCVRRRRSPLLKDPPKLLQSEVEGRIKRRTHGNSVTKHSVNFENEKASHGRTPRNTQQEYQQEYWRGGNTASHPRQDNQNIESRTTQERCVCNWTDATQRTPFRNIGIPTAPQPQLQQSAHSMRYSARRPHAPEQNFQQQLQHQWQQVPPYQSTQYPAQSVAPYFPPQYAVETPAGGLPNGHIPQQFANSYSPFITPIQAPYFDGGPCQGIIVGGTTYFPPYRQDMFFP